MGMGEDDYCIYISKSGKSIKTNTSVRFVVCRHSVC